MASDAEKPSKRAKLLGRPIFRHFRGFTADSSLFSNLVFVGENDEEVVEERNLKRSNSMDESSTIFFDDDSEMAMIDSTERFMAGDKLFEDALTDRKLIKRYIKLERLRKELNCEYEKINKYKENEAVLIAENEKLKLDLEKLRKRAREKEESSKAREEGLERLKEEVAILGAIVGYPPFDIS